jgi:putative transcriptional regulator
MKNRLREERILRGISQTDLAEAVGVSRQSIHAIERGKYIPSTLLALKIVRELNKSVEDIFLLD